MTEPLYVVTGVNRLTGEREALCKPHKRDWCERQLWKTQQQLYRRHHQPWLKLRAEPYEPELPFNVVSLESKRCRL